MSTSGLASKRGPNASIGPIQLCDKGPSISNRQRYKYVAIEQLDFEHVSYSIDLDFLADKLLQRIHLQNHISTQHQNLYTNTSAGSKRKRSSSPANGAPILQGNTPKRFKDEEGHAETSHQVELVETCCLFSVKAREAHDTDIILALKEMPDHPEHSWLNNLAFTVISHADHQRPDDTLIKNFIQLSDPTTGACIATLPVLKGQRYNNRRGRLTNGDWLLSLSSMLLRGAVTATFALSLAMPPLQYPSDRITAGSLFLRLSISVRVNVSTSTASSSPLPCDRILDMATIVRFADRFPDPDDWDTGEINDSFVLHHLRPATIDSNAEALQPAELNPTLLPFQRRSTAFMLGREGMIFDPNGKLVRSKSVVGHQGQQHLGLWWKKIQSHLYYNWTEARFVQNPELTLRYDFKGAMLAEEMGLGKTVEAVALMLLNPDPDAHSRPGWHDERNDIHVVPTKTTLIVAPETLRAQWIEEIEKHAPHLSVYSYQSRQKVEEQVPARLTWEQWAQDFDVMVISYRILSRELDAAKKAPDRSRRHQRKYERPRSPLVKLHFHRVLMDEVQMVGQSNAAEMVSMISRGSSVAVSGTPVKKLDDFKSCFRFLRVPGYHATSSEWQTILHPLLAPALVRVLRTIATRHTKAQVASEMSLPLQTRCVIPIDFTSIEAAFYADVWKDALDDIRYGSEGSPQSHVHQIDVAKMRNQLLLLRQACTHPQVALQFRGGVVGSRNLRSIDEVLELMIDSTRTELHSTRTHWFDRRVHRNILSLYRRDEDTRLLVASQFRDIQDEINKDILGFEQEIRNAAIVGPLYRFTNLEREMEQKAEARTKRLGSSNGKDDEDGDQALQAVVQHLEAYQALQQKRKVRTNHIIQLKSLLRSLLMKLHRLLQFVGNTYYQRGEYLYEQQKLKEKRSEAIKVESENDVRVRSLSASQPPSTVDAEGEPVSPFTDDTDNKENALAGPEPVFMSPERQSLKDQEDAAYAKAEKVRQRLLAEAGDEVRAAIARLDRDQVKISLQSIKASKDLFESGGGILSTDCYERLSENVDLLNEHAQVLFRWRESIIGRLVRPVNRDVSLEREDDDQYQENLDTQAEAEVLLEMYRPLLAEREKILKGAVAVGATDRPRLFKELEQAVRAARQDRLKGIAPETEADEELLRVQQQQLTHFKKLDEEQRSVSLAHPSQSFTGVAERLRSQRDSIVGPEEIALAKQAYIEARRIIGEQSKHLDHLGREERMLLTALFNARSQYFKEIQVLSDTVRDPIFYDLEKTIQATQKEEIETVSKVEDLERRLRYLLHLQMVQSTGKLDEAAKTCNICTDPIEIGILTNKCGHVCCENCWKEWQSQGHRTCVMCQTRVLPTEVHRIIYSSADATTRHGTVASAAEGQGVPGSADRSSNSADPLAVRYNELDGSLRSTLNRFAIEGRYGSKIDHVSKHVRHIINRTGEKSLIFSSFQRGLDFVAQSLTANGIRYVRLTGAGKMGSAAAKDFRSDPNIHVMLLHSEVQSSGLNLVAASHIHILEPFLDTNKELQAIGRVHRIGQTRETSVWCYYVKDTVEERILALSAYKGHSLYLRGRHTSSTEGLIDVAFSSSGPASGQSRQAASRVMASGRGKGKGAAGAMRGDMTSNSNELLACFFARYLPLQGQMPSVPAGATTSGMASRSNGIASAASTREQTATVPEGSRSRDVVEKDELTKLRRARLAALEQRQSTNLL
ncbi:related to IRC20 - putative helicase [Ustilago sp. UG-2017a]|nr:related to IRC20 - putative helicase [Ustilago sp. UG-2017a]